MKKVLLTAVVSALLVASCSQEEVVENDVSGEEHYKCHFILN